jgi:hypothetical protein
MDKNILCIEISKSDVYVEYTNQNYEYVSFTKAKKLIYTAMPSKINYSCVDDAKSVQFLNSLLPRYKLMESSLYLRNK